MPGEPSTRSLVSPKTRAAPDLSHHLSREARSRGPNPMKAIWKLAQGRPGAISLANGDPHPSLYPLRSMQFEVPSLSEDDPVLAWRSGSGGSQMLSTSDPFPASDSAALFKRAMGYTTGAGLPETQDVLARFTDVFHHPPNHQVTPSLGNFDAVTKCFRLLGDPGDSFLADEFTFTALTTAAVPQGIKWVPVPIDDGGLVPEALDALMSNWSEKERGRKPHVLYTTPSGQNPTGSTLSLARRKHIYKLARKWDLIIIEDDPYYFLQFEVTAEGLAPEAPGFATRYASRFTPSFLSMDIDGRVMRVDSFSKILAPGMRLGWITSSPFFTERLVYYTDGSTMHPHGFGQIYVLRLLAEAPEGWGIDGFARWLSGLREDYALRRDGFLRVFREVIGEGEDALAEANVPQAGMFFWVRVKLDRHPRFKRLQQSPRKDGEEQTNTAALMDELFRRLLDDGLVMMPASIFAVEEDDRPSDIHERCNYFRATFAGTEEIVAQGLSIFGQTLTTFFHPTTAADPPLSRHSIA